MNHTYNGQHRDGGASLERNPQLSAASRRVTKYTRETFTTSFTHAPLQNPGSAGGERDVISGTNFWTNSWLVYTRWRRSHFALMGSRKPASTASDTITHSEAYGVKSDIDYWPIFLCGQQNRDNRNVGTLRQRFSNGGTRTVAWWYAKKFWIPFHNWILEMLIVLLKHLKCSEM
jgi:hypothetical protein